MSEGHSDRAMIVWRRLDTAGHEAAQVVRTAEGWSLSGVAVFAHERQPCRLEYEITCDQKWQTIRCVVTGFVGQRAISSTISRDSKAAWTVDGAPVLGLAGCHDIDLAFSPVTNLLPINRLALETGGTARVRAAWLRFPELTVEVLEQVYTRLSHDRYRYESGDGAFQRELTIDASGFVLEYPGLWIAEARLGNVVAVG